MPNLWMNAPRCIRDADFPYQDLDFFIADLPLRHVQSSLKLYMEYQILSSNIDILCSAPKPGKSISGSYQRGPLVFALSFQLLVA